MSDLHALVAPYALDAVDDLDRRRFEAHLLECETCTAQIGGFAAAAAALAAAKSAPPPPRSLTDPAGGRLRSAEAHLPRGGHARAKPGAASCPRWPSLPRSSSPGRSDHLRDRRAQQRRCVAASTSMSAVLAAPDAATRSKLVAGGGTVRVVTSHARRAAVVAADQLPPLAKGKTYQVWTLASGDATSRGTFATSTVVTADRLGSADRVAVTVEPAGGSDRPSSLPVAVLPL